MTREDSVTLAREEYNVVIGRIVESKTGWQSSTPTTASAFPKS